MEIIELCPSCGAVMDKGEGHVQCPSCGEMIEETSFPQRKKGLSFGKKLALCAVLDVLDFTLFRLPVLGTLYDALLIAVAWKLFGGVGILSCWEVFDITDQIDAEIPTMTILCLLQFLNERKIFKFSQ